MSSLFHLTQSLPVPNDKMFLFYNGWITSHCVSISHKKKIHSSTDGYLSWFPSWANVNIAIVNTGMQVCFWHGNFTLLDLCMQTNDFYFFITSGSKRIFRREGRTIFSFLTLGGNTVLSPCPVLWLEWNAKFLDKELDLLNWLPDWWVTYLSSKIMANIVIFNSVIIELPLFITWWNQKSWP